MSAPTHTPDTQNLNEDGNDVGTSVTDLTPKITVVGVGGAGGNAVNNMIKLNLEGVEFVVCNTDAQALVHSKAKGKLQLGQAITQGLGAGSKPDVGRASAEESLEEVIRQLDGNHMVFITAGMGGGTGTGAAPVIARAARERGILTVGVVTKPFHFEGSHRMRTADHGIEELQKFVDTLIIIPNQNLFRIANEQTTFADAFSMADNVLYSGVRGVTDLMVMPGLINLDFADIRSVMSEMGKAMMGTGEAEGDGRAISAAEAAISNPLLEDVSMRGAKGVLINITGGMDMTLFEVDEAANRIRDEIETEANIIFGSAFDQSMDGRMRVSIVATGIDGQEEEQPTPQRQSLAPTPQPRPLIPETVTVAKPVAPAASTTPEVAPAQAAPSPTPMGQNVASQISGQPTTQQDTVQTEKPAAQQELNPFGNAPTPVAAPTQQPQPAPIQSSSASVEEIPLIDDTAPAPARSASVNLAPNKPVQPLSASQDATKKPFSFLGRFSSPAKQQAQSTAPTKSAQGIGAGGSVQGARPATTTPTQPAAASLPFGGDTIPTAGLGEQPTLSPMPEAQKIAPAAQASMTQPTPKPAVQEPAEDQLDIPAFLRRKK